MAAMGRNGGAVVKMRQWMQEKWTSTEIQGAADPAFPTFITATGKASMSANVR